MEKRDRKLADRGVPNQYGGNRGLALNFVGRSPLAEGLGQADTYKDEQHSCRKSHRLGSGHKLRPKADAAA